MKLGILKYWNLGIFLTLLLGIGWIKISSVPETSQTSDLVAMPQPGFLAPDFSLQTIAGETVTLSDLRGHIILVNFWASWCPPCRAEMPAMQNVYDDYQAKGLIILAVNSTIQDSQSDADKFTQNVGLSFPILYDFDGITTTSYQIEALPTSFFIDRDGIVQKVIIGGPMPEASLRELVENLLDRGN